MAYVTFWPALEPVQQDQVRELTKAIESRDHLERVVTMLGERWNREVRIERPPRNRK